MDQEFRLGTRLDRISDPRSTAQIPLPTMLSFFLYGSAAGLKSFQDMDLHARAPAFRRFFKSSRQMIASNSTFERVLRALSVEPIAELQGYVGRVARAKGYTSTTLPSGRRVHLGILDGTVAGGEYYSVLDLCGTVDALVDVEPYTKGHELAAGERLLRRNLQHRGAGFVDYLMGDGLYITAGMLRLVRDELKAHLVVKTKEVDSLNIIKTANWLFDSPRAIPEVEYVRGEDPTRGVSYEVWAASGFMHQGIGPLKVARVVEKPLNKPNAQPRVFWVITTDVNLSAEDMRFLGHERWSIENGGFKGLNAIASSKHQWVQKLRPRESWSPQETEQRSRQRDNHHQVVVRLQMVAYMLLQMFKDNLDLEEIRAEFGSVPITLTFVSQRLLETVEGSAQERAVRACN